MREAIVNRALLRGIALVAVAAVAACGDGVDSPVDGATDDALTHIDTSPGVQQTISDCWDFATSGWIESLSRRPVDARPVDISEAYVSYIYWYRQLRDPQFKRLNVLGGWGLAVEYLRRYGWMSETDFLSQPATAFAARHAEALEAIQLEIRPGGRLATPQQRADHAHVVSVLNHAWRLQPEITDGLARAFGPGLDRNLLDPATSIGGTPLHRLDEITVGFYEGKRVTAADLVGTPHDANDAFNGIRDGELAFTYVRRPTNDADLPAYFRRAQMALLEDLPVPMSIMSDMDQDDATGTFQAPANGRLSDPGAHLVMVFDSTVKTADFGILRAGVPENRPDARAETIRDDAQVLSFRARNSSWGSYTVPGQTIPAVPGTVGVNDYTIGYLSLHLPVTDDNPGGAALRSMVLPKTTFHLDKQ